MNRTRTRALPAVAGRYSIQCARRALPALLLAVSVALGSCGGSGTGSSSGGGSGGGTTATSFYLSGPAGVQTDTGYFALVAVRPDGTSQSTISTNGAWKSAATVAEWTENSGAATFLGNRYRVWTDAGDSFLHGTDLAVVSGASAPTSTQLSSLVTKSVCAGLPPAVLNDYANPSNSVIVYRVAAFGCGTPNDEFTAIPLSAAAGTAPSAPSLSEPVAAAYDASGAIVKVALVQHANNPPTVAVATSVTAAPVTIGPLVGNGWTYNGGNFQSLGVINLTSGAVIWLYRDAFRIVAVNLSAPTSAPVVVYSAADSDVPQGPAFFDATTAYIGVSDSATTVKIVSIDTTAIGTNSGVEVLADNTTGGLKLIGVAGPNLVYFVNGGSVLKAVPKVSAAGNPVNNNTFLIYTATTPLSLGNSPVIVGNGVYYTVYSQNAVPQAYYFNGGQVSTAIPGTSGSEVLGGVAASPVSTANPGAPAYASAVVAQLAPGSSPANPYTGATVSGYGFNGTLATTFGILPTLKSGLYNGIALSEGPLQAGMAALLEMSGTQTNSGNPAADLFLFTPGSAGLTQVTNNLQ